MLRRKSLLVLILVAVLCGCNGTYNSGDRVLVEKFAYDFGLGGPQRFDVVVFKWPVHPIENGVPKNYIKRLLGLPGELIAIFFGQLFFFDPGPDAPPLFDDRDNMEAGKAPSPINRLDLWKKEYMHIDAPRSEKLFNTAGKFKIVRKPAEVMLAMRRIVNDNDFQPSDLDPNKYRRWNRSHVTKTAWTTGDDKVFANDGTAKDLDWVHYQHNTRPGGWDQSRNADRGREENDNPKLITDFMDYNYGEREDGRNLVPGGLNWVGDLMIECQLNVAKPQGEFLLELSRGINRYQARFDLATGECSLYQLTDGKAPLKMTSAPTRVKGPGQYNLRLANFDASLTLWVDHDLPFRNGNEPGHNFPPPEIRNDGEDKLTDEELQARRGPTKNDVELPASIGSHRAEVQVSHLRLWRNTYYTLMNDANQPDASTDSWSDPTKWGALRKLNKKIMYVQKGHYLCLGDNSPMSSDGRDWGLVPNRLMLGRALIVYWPYNRAGAIR